MSQQWFYLEGQEQRGPLTWQELSQKARSGALRPEQLVWTEGMTDWTPGREIQGLFAMPPPPPLPPPSPSPSPSLQAAHTPPPEAQAESKTKPPRKSFLGVLATLF